MTPNDFNYLREMLKETSGLVLSEDKKYLIESRLMPIAKKINFDSISSMVSELQRSKSTDLKNKIVEAMTINESFFFRDKVPFDNFKKVMLPKLLETNATTKHIRIWSAAASTGQEAYSLAMILREHKKELEGWRVDIIGTDICSQALEKAKSGLYSQFEVQRGMPVNYLVQNFKQNGTTWQINPNIISMVQYRQFNLLNNYTILGRFDIIFCRNVLIYFDKDTKKDIISRMAKQANPNCFLVLGSSETLVGMDSGFEAYESVRSLYAIKSKQKSANRNTVRSPQKTMPGSSTQPSMLKTANTSL